MLSASSRYRCSIVNQTLAAMIRDRPFDASLCCTPFTWTPDAVSQVLRSVPALFFSPPTSVGCQSYSPRHRHPLRQRRFHLQHAPVLQAPASRLLDLSLVDFGVAKATHFFRWLELHSGFTHDESTVKEMAMLFAKAHNPPLLWDFLKEVTFNRDGLVTTTTVTCLMKCLAEDGLVNEAECTFYKMKYFNCKPDVYAYNALMFAYCRIGFFTKARALLQQMELPGFRCPPDIFTYTVLISSFCRHSMQTKCKKAVRRRMWEANHMFRQMLFQGVVPDIVTYNALIDACCKTKRIERALDLFLDMNKRGCVPNRVTYDSFIRYYSVVKNVGNAVKMLRRMQEMSHGTPSTSSYTPIIHALCETRNAVEALGFLVELLEGGSIPREYTYKLVCDALGSQDKADLLEDTTRKKIEDGIILRFKQRRIAKPLMSRKNYDLTIVE